MRLFHAREFSNAKALFERAARGPGVEIAHAARMHARMCERRLQAGGPVLQTAEDRYNYGVALMNQGRLSEAADQLRKAVGENDRAGHYHYALALCCALQGDAPGSAGHLRRAIQIEPGNRIAAINDPDFRRVASHPSLRDLLAVERTLPG
jgi:tetratricopeptide (TPR) repeat protein